MIPKLVPVLFLTALLNAGCMGVVVPQHLYQTGIPPSQPKPEGKVFLGWVLDGPTAYKYIDSADVDSLKPTFQWVPYQGPHEKNVNRAGNPEIKNITYEIRVWPQEDYYWSKPAYHKTGIMETQHTLERALEPSTEYLWSLRAWFDLNGHRRVTDWSVAFIQPIHYGHWKENRRYGQVYLKESFPFETP